MTLRAELYTDGGSRGNPGPSGIGFVLTRVPNSSSTKEESGDLRLCSGGAFIGQATNNQAEYWALIWGLQNALAQGVQIIDICADSQLVVNQLLGLYEVKSPKIKPLYKLARTALTQFKDYTVKHIYRDKNSEADALVNQAMNREADCGDFLINFTSLIGEQ